MLTTNRKSVLLLLSVFLLVCTCEPTTALASRSRRTSAGPGRPRFGRASNTHTDSKVARNRGQLFKRDVLINNELPTDVPEVQNSIRGPVLWSSLGVLLLSTFYCFQLLFPGTSLTLEPLSLLGEKILDSYKKSMVLHPLQTKVATGASLAIMGDAMAQSMELNIQHYDTRRAASFAAFDGSYRVFQHLAFPVITGHCKGRVLTGLLSVIPSLVVGGNLRLFLAAVERTLTYQLAVIPLLYYPVFFMFTGFIQGLSVSESFQRAKQNFLPCWKRNLMFWIPIQLVMFGLVDEKWQIPFVCVMGVIWSTILSVTVGKAKNATKSS
jgi:protein Mpv17